MLVSKSAKICVIPNAKAKICITPKANRWSTDCIGHVHFMLCMSISVALDTQGKPVFEWKMFLMV